MSVELRPSEFVSHPIDTVVYAGQSPRRAAWLTHCFSPTPVVAVSGGVEKDIEDVAEIAGDKLDHVLGQRHLINPTHQSGVVLFASDIRTKILTTNGEEAYLHSQGKPKNEEAVRQIFMAMIKAAAKTHLPPFYVVDSASGHHYINGTQQRLLNRNTEAIILEEKLITYFATEAGFSEYMDRFESFYNSSLEHSIQIPKLTHLAGGICLEVLAQAGAIYAIGQTTAQRNQEFFSTLKSALYHVTVGISPQLMRPFQPNVQQQLDDWPWLNQLTELSMPEENKT